MPDNRQMLLKQAADKEELAAQFDRYAQDLARVFTEIPSAGGWNMEFWTGPGADRFVAQARELDRGIDELMEFCVTTAGNLRRRAQLLRKEAAQVQV